MNKRTIRMVTDMVIAILLAVGLSFLTDLILPNLFIEELAIFLLPLVWCALRHGAAAGVISGAITGLLIGLLEFGYVEWLNVILYSIIPVLTVGLAGFFAKYTQKTLNNRRYSSTYLNIFTASFLTTIGYYFLRYVLVPIGLNESSPLELRTSGFWLSMALTWLVTAAILALMARSNSKLLIPARTKYLSRHETSSLLND